MPIIFKEDFIISDITEKRYGYLETSVIVWMRFTFELSNNFITELASSIFIYGKIGLMPMCLAFKWGGTKPDVWRHLAIKPSQ
jgi:hypothetical protein